MRYFKIMLGAALVLCPPVFTAPVAAHHSFAMFDRTKEVTIAGTVRVFEWTNPHSWLQVVVPASEGRRATEYSIEMGSPNTMSRQGWRRTTFKPGDRVRVVMYPMRDGSPGGAFVSAVNASGQALPITQ
jgi:hypothetical protein